MTGLNRRREEMKEYRCRECGHQGDSNSFPREANDGPPYCPNCRGGWLDTQTETTNFDGFDRRCRVCGESAVVWDGVKQGYCSKAHFDDPAEIQRRAVILGGPSTGVHNQPQPMVADVLAYMREHGVTQDEAVIALGGHP